MVEKPFSAYEGDEPYFFVSYDHDETDLVYPEMAWLEAAGFNLWYDDGIHVGAVWRQALADALSGASGLVFFATARSVESSNCLKEINFILDEEKPVFVIQLDNTPLPGLLRLSLSDRQSLVKSEYSDDTYKARLVSALSTVVPPAVRGASGEAPQSARTAMKTDPPSIAVLPFSCLGNDEELKYLAQGVTGDLIAKASQRIWHIVTGQPEDLSAETGAVGEKRSVRYLLGGTVQARSGRVRVVARLTDTGSGQELWAQRYERTGDDFLEIQDQIANSIDFELFDGIMLAEDKRLRGVPDSELDAWGLCVRTAGIPVVDRESRDRKRSLVEQAIACDPNFAVAHGLYGVILATIIVNQFTHKPEEDGKLAVEEVNKALMLAPNNMFILYQASYVHRLLGDMEHALHLAERADRIVGRVWAATIDALITLGRYEEALEMGREATGEFSGSLAIAALTCGNLDEALEFAHMGTTMWPRNYLAWMTLASVQATLGRDDQARQSFARAKEIVPSITVTLYEKGNRIGWRNREEIIDALIAPLRRLDLDS